MNGEQNVIPKNPNSFTSLLDTSSDIFSVIQDFLVLVISILTVIGNAIVRNIVPRFRKDLKSDVVLITGSALGIGKQLALETAKLGAKVVLWDINKEQLEAVKEEITSSGGEAFAYVCDVTSESDVKSKVEVVEKEVGDVTVLINNAGVMQNVPILDLDSEKIKRTFEVNTLSHFWTIRAFLPKMQEKNYGHIVAIASAAGILGHINQTDYSASKFAVVGLMESLFEELRQKGSKIRLTTICPMTVNTGMNQHPVTKFPWMMPILTVEEVAKRVLIAIRREDIFVTIPRRLEYWIKFGKFFPPAVISEIMDVLEYCRVPNKVPGISEETK